VLEKFGRTYAFENRGSLDSLRHVAAPPSSLGMTEVGIAFVWDTVGEVGGMREEYLEAFANY